MSTENNNILVAYDFSEAAETGLNYAAILGKETGAEVILLHIVPDNTKVGSKDWEMTAGKLQNACHKVVAETGARISWRIKEGNIFDGIGAAGTETNSRFILMPTHGKRGMQHLTGSYAGKVIMKSLLPVVVTQKGSDAALPKKVLLPFDFSEPVEGLLFLGKYFFREFDAELQILVSSDAKDNPDQKVDLSFSEMKEILNREAIPYRIIKAGLGGSWVGQILNNIETKSPDLVIIGVPGAVGEAFPRNAQQIITNKFRIPVVCLR